MLAAEQERGQAGAPVAGAPETGSAGPALGLFACAMAFLLPVVFSPSTYSAFWAPKAALLPLVAAAGLPGLLALVRRSGPNRPPALAAAGLLAIALLSSALSDSSLTLTMLGQYGTGTGTLFVAALGGAWAIGASLDDEGRRRVGQAFLAGVLLNVFFALVSMVVDLSTLGLGLFEGRSMGLEGNPVHLGAAAAAGLALLVARVERRPRSSLLLVALTVASIQVSGARGGFIAVAMVLVWGVARLGRRLGATLIVAVLVGVAGGAALADAGGGFSVSSRVADGSGGGLDQRVGMWWTSRHALADSPLLGSGPGTYRVATARYRTAGVARTYGPDRWAADAHNLVVEYATTTGLLGVAALLAWVGLAVRRARGPLLIAALALLAVGLTQPQWPGTTPVAFLLLGAAASWRAPSPATSRGRVLGLALLVVAAAGTGRFLVGDFHLQQARLDFDSGHAAAALRLLPEWPEPATIRARIETFAGRAERDERKLAGARSWRLEAIRRDPTNPELWLVLADADGTEGRTAEARTGYLRVLTENPVSTRAMNALADLAVLVYEDEQGGAEWLRRSLAVDPNQPGVRRTLEGLGRS